MYQRTSRVLGSFATERRDDPGLRGREDGFMKRLAVAIIGAFFLSACASGGGGTTVAGTPKAGGTLKIALESELRTLDPLKSSQRVERQVYYNMYDSLVTIDPSLKIKAGPATPWQLSAPPTPQFPPPPGGNFHDRHRF